MPKRRRVLGNIALGVLAAAAAGAVAFSIIDSSPAGPEPVSAKVQDYYNKNVASAKPTLAAAPAVHMPVVAFMGDSYTAYSGSWALKLSAAEDWQGKLFALGGTGYAKAIPSGGVPACGKDVCGNYLTQAPAVLAFKPEMVVVSGGRNDLHEDPAVVQANATKLFTTLAKGLPDAKVIVTSPVWDASPLPEGFAEITAAIKAAATASGAQYVDIGQPLANHPELIGPDGVHPTNEGHAVLAATVAKALD